MDAEEQEEDDAVQSSFREYFLSIHPACSSLIEESKNEEEQKEMGRIEREKGRRENRS